MTSKPTPRRTKILRNRAEKILTDALKDQGAPAELRLSAAIAILQHVIPQQKTTNS
ncbi:hypothetical protein [Methylotuvimicrobium sp. KM2]|uniref:hypothetical protein n=1 Tax=Methylotuvimicrobium sp. KM2 TaxID=3133976 RepID=UPI003100C0DA